MSDISKEEIEEIRKDHEERMERLENKISEIRKEMHELQRELYDKNISEEKRKSISEEILNLKDRYDWYDEMLDDEIRSFPY